jgi:hypothetical protein
MKAVLNRLLSLRITEHMRSNFSKIVADFWARLVSFPFISASISNSVRSMQGQTK